MQIGSLQVFALWVTALFWVGCDGRLMTGRTDVNATDRKPVADQTDQDNANPKIINSSLMIDDFDDYRTFYEKSFSFQDGEQVSANSFSVTWLGVDGPDLKQVLMGERKIGFTMPPSPKGSAFGEFNFKKPGFLAINGGLIETSVFDFSYRNNKRDLSEYLGIKLELSFSNLSPQAQITLRSKSLGESRSIQALPIVKKDGEKISVDFPFKQFTQNSQDFLKDVTDLSIAFTLPLGGDLEFGSFHFYQNQ